MRATLEAITAEGERTAAELVDAEADIQVQAGEIAALRAALDTARAHAEQMQSAADGMNQALRNIHINVGTLMSGEVG